MAKRILSNAFDIAEKKQGLQGLADVSFKIKNNPIKERVVEEKRTEVLQIKLTPSEKKKFISLIGDETGSDIGRLLIQEFIKSNS